MQGRLVQYLRGQAFKLACFRGRPDILSQGIGHGPRRLQAAVLCLFVFGSAKTVHAHGDLSKGTTNDGMPIHAEAEQPDQALFQRLGLSNFNYGVSFLSLTDKITSVEESRLNPDNISDVPDLVFDNSFILNFETEKVIGRAKFINRQFSGGEFAGRFKNNEVRLQNLYYTFYPGESLDLTIGKRSLPLDNGYASAPLNFFTNTKFGNDLTDRYSEAEGIPLVALTYYYGKFATTIAIGDDFENDDLLGTSHFGRKQAVVQQFVDLGNYQTAFIAQQYDDSKVGIGGTVSAVYGLGLELHASVFGREGSDRFYSLANIDPAASPFDVTRSNHLRNSSHFFLQSVIGANYTTGSFINIIAEWIHDDRGLSSSQWDRKDENINFYRMLRATDPVTGNALLSATAATLSAEGARRDYLYLRVAKTIEDWSLDTGLQIGIADGSTLSTWRASYAGFKSTAIDLNLRFTTGSEDSEYGLIAEKIRLGFAARYTF